MNMCRTCLKTPANIDISELEKVLNEDKQNCVEIMKFCLGIKIIQDSKITTKVCEKCYRKIASFYKFKAQSLKNDAYLKSLNPVVRLIDHVLTSHVNNEVKHEDFSESENYYVSYENGDTDIKIEIDQNTLEDVKSEEAGPIIKCEYAEDDGLEKTKIYRNSERSIEVRSKKITKKNRTYKKVPGKKKYKSRRGDTGNSTQEGTKCEECGKYVLNLVLHSIRHQTIDKSGLWQCQGCSKQVSSKGSLVTHFKTQHLGLKVTCRICTKDLSSRSRLLAHLVRRHAPSVTPFECPTCARHFVSQSALDGHMVKHTNMKSLSRSGPLECDICHKKYSTKSTLMVHIRSVHLKERNYQCEVCSKTFFDNRTLVEHTRTHTRERLYKCSDCEKSFWTRDSLGKHRVTHRTVKNYQCHVCDKTFSKLGNLKYHMLTHTKEKAFACRFCNVRFGRSHHRLRHERTMHLKHDGVVEPGPRP